ncbi:hypothetical protein DXG01_012801 [Tephrocybe rancida]|nr:hypothetical protein DXG01_012801 [Tephrocybe rancida]
MPTEFTINIEGVKVTISNLENERIRLTAVYKNDTLNIEGNPGATIVQAVFNNDYINGSITVKLEGNGDVFVFYDFKTDRRHIGHKVIGNIYD